MIFSITVSTKKGVSQSLRFLVEQTVYFPSISGGSFMRWEGIDNRPDGYARYVSGLGRNYSASLLRSDYDAAKAKNNRLDYAGYEGAPGSVVLRGVDLGELRVDVSGHPQAWIAYKVRGFGNATSGEKLWLDAQIGGHLLKWINDNRAALWRDAIAGLAVSFHDKIKAAREQIDALEAQAGAALIDLTSKGPQ